ncbi:MAG: hypothetical protein GKR89_02835 [Candidatus Latescibacteria bacterium]|nr:hypothetical protein [Candidatus Latescibacterota bacterium]
MTMAIARLLLGLLLLGIVEADGQAFAPYEERSRFLAAPPGSGGLGLLGYLNPAVLTYAQGMETVAAWTDPEYGDGSWGLYSAWSRLGFGSWRRRLPVRLHRRDPEPLPPGRDLTEHRLSLAGGDRRLGVGLGYGWASGATRRAGTQNNLVLGALWRPGPRFSLGGVFTTTLDGQEREGVVEATLRSLGHPRLSFFGENTWATDAIDGRTYWSAGLAFEPLPGLALSGRLSRDNLLSIGLRLGLGGLGGQMQAVYDDQNDPAYTAYRLRMGGYQRSAVRQRLRPQRPYLRLELTGLVKHRRFALFDEGRTLVQLLAFLQRVQDDPDLGGLALNLSGLRISPTSAWEVRQKLAAVQQTGKRVVVYIDRVDLGSYHLASVADQVVLDPLGMIALEGFVAGGTYLAGTLGKVGIGFEEWRYFDYKSANEFLARDDMSAPDRRQLQALLDDFYDLARGDICLSRGLETGAFDRLVDDETLFMPQAALERGLVDRLGRWDAVDEAIAALEGQPRPLLAVGDYPLPDDDRWGGLPRIAVVYALGVCALDQGINARQLARTVRAAKDDPGIAAVVLRVDSPGGDALAADLVAAELLACKERKPVIISQGYVAASGGYWLSMYGDAVVAAPNTITGSIGVIGGWLYDQGLKEKLGVTTDHVQVGRSADLDFGMRLPFIGLQLPDRNLDEREQAVAEGTIRTLYADFVARVAKGRGVAPEVIEAVAQGRVWSGRAALAAGLVDTLGGLETAVHLAKEKAGIAADQRVRLVELPAPALFAPGLLTPRLVGAGQPSRPPMLDYLQFRLQHNGRPLLLLPQEYLNSEYLDP